MVRYGVNADGALADPVRRLVSRAELGDAAAVLLQGDAALQTGDWILRRATVAEDVDAIEIVAAADAKPIVVRRQRQQPARPMIFGIAREELELTSWTEAFSVAGGWTRQMIFDSMSTIARFFAPRDQGGVDHERALAGPVGIFNIFKATLETHGLKHS